MKKTRINCEEIMKRNGWVCAFHKKDVILQRIFRKNNKYRIYGTDTDS